jgi:hypothetical protein
MSISIPQTLLQTLQASFDIEAKKLAKDAAKLLRVPEKDVLHLLKQVPKVQFKVFDDTEIPTSCPVFLETPRFLQKCRRPCILGTGRCTHHQSITTIPTLPDTVLQLTRVRCEGLSEPLWCDEDTQQIYNGSGTIVGKLEEETITLYTFEA